LLVQTLAPRLLDSTPTRNDADLTPEFTGASLPSLSAKAWLHPVNDKPLFLVRSAAVRHHDDLSAIAKRPC